MNLLYNLKKSTLYVKSRLLRLISILTIIIITLPTSEAQVSLGGVNLGHLTDYLFVFTNGSADANWQGATKGFAGNVAVSGNAKFRTSGGVPFAGTISTDGSSLGAWQDIITQNSSPKIVPTQAFGLTGQTAVTSLATDLSNAFSQINALTPTSGYTGVSATSLNGLNTQDGISKTYVINITSGLQVSSYINITGDAGDVFILRWDTDGNPANGYQGQVKFQSGGGIVPLGGLKATNFINVAGDLNCSGGGSNPPAPYPQGPRTNDGTGSLISGATDFSGGGFFTGYWLTTGDPSNGQTSPFSNGNFVGGWYTSTNKFSMTSGTNGVYVTPPVIPASLGDFVWNDLNGNGIQDSGEPGIPNATVKLYTCGGTLVATTTTNSSGIYSFTNLAPGSYYVVFTAPTGYSFTTQNAGTNTAVDSDPNKSTGQTACVTLTSGQNNTTVDAGLYQPASLGDFVWNDLNGNGIQDSGEPGVSGVTVKLYTCGGTLVATTTTNSTGIYSFTNLAPGSYYVVFTAPTGNTFTTQNAGTNTAIDSDPNSSGQTACVTLTSGQSNTTVDAGLLQPASLGDFVWNDLNGNGIQDSGEPGVSGVTVKLYTCGGTLVATTTTNSSGIYSFNNLAPGSYYVVFTAPTGNTFTTQNAGTNTAIDSDPNSSGQTACVTLTSGQSNTTVDAGLLQPASLGDFVWNDLNGNGIQDSGEPGVSGVTVKLYTCGGTLVATTTTNSSGIYSFTNLAPGSYYVVFTAPTGYSFTTQNAGTNTAVDSDPNKTTGQTACVTLTSGQSNLTVDAGLLQPASLGDFVWNDLNGNGIQDSGEPGVSGVTVKLYTCGGTLVATTTTNSSGIYSFTNLAPGSYYVVFTAPTGYSFTTQNAGTNTAADSDPNKTTGQTACVTLTSGQSNTTVDAGLTKNCVPTTSTTNVSICPTALPYVWNGTSYNAAGSYTIHLINKGGCDSAATLNLTVKQATSSSTNVSLCSASLPYVWNETSYTAAGSYTIHLTNKAGCDSAATLNLTVKQATSSTTNVSVCSASLPYVWNGTSYTAAGSYTIHLTNKAGCDSAATLILVVKLGTTSATSVSVCSNNLPYAWNGQSFSSAGTYVVHLTNKAGCDSAATLNLTVKQASSSSTSVTVCSNTLPYVWNGTSYTAAGSYTIHLTNKVGCDSAATLVLTVKQATSSTTNVSICSNTLPYVWNGTSYTAAGSYTTHLTNKAGCDSAATLNLTVKQSTSSTTNASVCSASLPYVWNGTSYNTAGTYTIHLTNKAGCDSAATLILVVKQGTTSATSVSVCSNNLPYAWNGQSFSAAGTYVVHLTNKAGCDSAATLNLTVKQASSSSTSVTVCSNALPYVWNGTSFTAAGSYTVHLTNKAECDSAATLVLTVKQATSSTTNVSVCSNTLPYVWNGTSYTAAGSYTIHLTNIAGCDSAATLNLTVKQATSSTTNVSVCSASLPYVWNGTSYNATGSYTIHLTNKAGCDSAATLKLTVNQPTTSTTKVTICAVSLPYVWNGTSYTAGGTYVKHFTNKVGCDSAATLILTVNQATSSLTYVTVCSDKLPYVWNGQSFNSAGTYTIHLVNKAGCDSAASICIKINQATSSTTYFTVGSCCLPYHWNGQSYSTSGTYVVHLTNSVGCDSAATLILTVSQSTGTSSNVNSSIEISQNAKMGALAWPNPSESFFNLKITGSHREVAQIKVYDMLGRILDQKQANTGEIVQFGGRYRQGMYIIEIHQGTETKVIKAVKE